MAISVDMTGCIENKQEYEEQACRLLEEKYRESFEVMEYYGRDSIEDTCSLLMVSNEHPDVLFEATVACDGSYIIDEYVAARVCRKIEEKMTENLSILPGYTVIKVKAVSRTIDSADADMSPEEFANIKSKNKYIVGLHYCPQNQDADITPELENAFQGLEFLNGYMDVYVANEAVLKEVQAYLEESARMDYGYEKLLESVEKNRIYFENGRIE